MIKRELSPKPHRPEPVATRREPSRHDRWRCPEATGSPLPPSLQTRPKPALAFSAPFRRIKRSSVPCNMANMAAGQGIPRPRRPAELMQNFTHEGTAKMFLRRLRAAGHDHNLLRRRIFRQPNQKLPLRCHLDPLQPRYRHRFSPHDTYPDKHDRGKPRATAGNPAPQLYRHSPEPRRPGFTPAPTEHALICDPDNLKADDFLHREAPAAPSAS